MRKSEFLVRISSVSAAVLLVITYVLVKSSNAQMMGSPTPASTPSTNNSAALFVLAGAAIIVAIAVVIIYFLYSRNKNKKIGTFPESKSTTHKLKQPTNESKIDSNNKDSRPFDVFLCYKKSSGKDYADHLKSGLEELGLHTFEDCKDIPQTVDSEEGWACSLDKALEESKYFVVIMTPGFELSREVVNEIRMARKQTNKIFVYFRHRNMGRNIVVNLGDEALDIGKTRTSIF